MRLHRFRIRTLMIAVAVAGIGLGAGFEVARLGRVRAARQRDAAWYAVSEEMARDYARESNLEAKRLQDAADSCRTRHDLDPVGIRREVRPLSAGGEVSDSFADILDRAASRERSRAAQYDREAHHWATMTKAYERGARYPWLPVPPDPHDPPRRGQSELINQYQAGHQPHF